MSARSPTVVTPLPQSSAPATPLVKEAPPTTPQTVPFPSPQTFDIIPPLHGLLLRLLSAPNNADGAGNGARAPDDPGVGAPSGPSAPDQAQSQPQQPGSIGNETSGNNGLLGAGPATAEMTGLGSSLPSPLDIKNLPTQISSIKIRIQKAHAVVESLPDIGRSVADQESEIEELEDRIAKLKSVISDFGKKAGAGSSLKPKAIGS